MSKPAIIVDRLSKAYQIGQAVEKWPTFRDALVHGLKAPLRRLRQLRGRDARDETFWALKDVSFEVQPGEVVGIIGRNGAGKSTLLKILSRITEPTSGEVRLRGRVASLLEVGTGFHPELTGRENIHLNGAILGMKRAEIDRKFDEIVAFAEIDRFLDTPVKRYSSGMYVRLAFAVAAHLEPEILIVDEVLAVGDAEFQKKCLGKMREVAQGEGRTVLFVSHNMAAIEALCSSAVLLTAGRLTDRGSVRPVVTKYNQTGVGNNPAGSVQGALFFVESISVTGAEGRLRTFGSCQIIVRYSARQDLIDAGAHILFEDMDGNSVLGLDSSDFCKRQPLKRLDLATFCFHIHSLPLNPGLYRLRTWLKSEQDHLYWEVPGAVEIEVPLTAVYGCRPVERQWHGTTATRASCQVTTA